MKLVRLTCPKCRVPHEYPRRVLITKLARCACGTYMGAVIERYVTDELREMRGDVTVDLVAAAERTARELIEAAMRCQEDEKATGMTKLRVWN
jgi:hypothetical protein